MKFHIIGDPSNSNKAKGNNDSFLVNKLNKEIKNGKQLFIFIFMDGCGPCNTTKPLWDNVRPKLEQQYKNDDSTIVVRLNKDLFNKFHNIGEEPAGFPTLRRIADSGNIIEEYENSGLDKLDRSTDSFINWIKKHVKSKMHTPSHPHRKHKMTRTSRSHSRPTLQSRRSRHYGGKKRSTRKRR